MSRLLTVAGLAIAFGLAAAPAGAIVPAGGGVARSPLAGMRDLGRTGGSAPVELAVSLKYRNAAELDRLVALQGTPGSPLFHHFLTNRQFDAAFGPTAADYARTIATLRREGFTIAQEYANHTLIDVTAPAATVERSFGTELHDVAQPGAGIGTVAMREPAIPAELAGTVDQVDGFDSVVTVRPFAHARRGVAPDTGPITHNGSEGPNATSIGYDFPSRHGADGTGLATANVICGDFQESDLKAFLSYFVIPRTGPATTRVRVNGGAPYFPPSRDPQNCSIESSLDVQTIVGNAPGTAFYEYLIPTLSSKHIEDAYNRVVSDNAVVAVNSSFGGCETQGKRFVKMSDKIATQGAAKGITFDASSGDSGSAVCSPKGVSSPASAPHFMAIGGTNLTVDGSGNYVSETGWSGSGGGVSVIFAEPSYQKLISGPIAGHRNLPDIAFASVNVAIYDGGSWFGGDGTSWSGPLYAALQTEIDQVVNSRAGQANTLYYTLAASSGASTFFHDITSGSNGAYKAGPGYDNVTGIGSVQGENTAKAF